MILWLQDQGTCSISFLQQKSFSSTHIGIQLYAYQRTYMYYHMYVSMKTKCAVKKFTKTVRLIISNHKGKRAKLYALTWSCRYHIMPSYQKAFPIVLNNKCLIELTTYIHSSITKATQHFCVVSVHAF